MKYRSFLSRNSYSILFLCVFLTQLCSLLPDFSKGIDLTDESFYLINASSLMEISASVTSFGHFTKLMLDAVNGNIFLFRLFGLFILLMCAGYFAKELERYCCIYSNNSFDQLRVPWQITIITSSLSFYCIWLITPSYNWLNLISCLLVCAASMGLVVSKKNIDRHISISYSEIKLFTISFGLCVSFFAKPPTVLFLLVGVVFLFSLSFNFRAVLSIFSRIAIISFCILVISIYLFENSISVYFWKLELGLELLFSLQSTHGFSVYYDKIMNVVAIFDGHFVQLIAFGVISVVFYLFYVRKKLNSFSYWSLSKRYKILLTSVFLLMTLYVFWLNGYFYGRKIGFLGLGLVGFYVFFSLLISVDNHRKTTVQRYEIARAKIWPALTMLFFLMAFSIGSSSHAVLVMSHGFVFIAASVSYLVRNIDKFEGGKYFQLSCMVIILFVVVLNLRYAQEHPYRLVAALNKQTNKVNIPLNGNSLYVDSITAKYIRDIKVSALKAGWREGTPLIDFTGATPFVSYYLKAKIVVVPWLFGGYKGSEAFARKVIANANKEDLDTAWLLISPNGRLKINLSVLFEKSDYEIKNYTKVGEFVTGYRNETQELWKPTFERNDLN